MPETSVVPAKPGALRVRAQALARELGSVISVLAVSADGAELTVEVACHEDPSFDEALASAAQARYRRGESIPGRVWETGEGILIPEVDRAALEATLHPAARPAIRAVEVRSLMMVPVWHRGRVVGTLGAYRGARVLQVFGEAEFERLKAFASELGSSWG